MLLSFMVHAAWIRARAMGARLEGHRETVNGKMPKQASDN